MNNDPTYKKKMFYEDDRHLSYDAHERKHKEKVLLAKRK